MSTGASHKPLSATEASGPAWAAAEPERRGAERSGCGGRTFRRSFTFDAAALRRTGNEIVLRINENTPPELGNDLAYDAIKLELNR